MENLTITSVEALAALSASAASAASAQNALAKTATALRTALKNAIAGFDELHILTQQSAASSSAGKKTSAATGKKNTVGKGTGTTLPDRSTLPEEHWARLTENAQGYTEAVTALPALAQTVSEAVQAAFAPLTAALAHIWDGLVSGFAAAWAAAGPGVLGGVAAVADGIGTLLGGMYSNVLAPLISSVAGGLTWLWDSHLSTLWANLTGMLGSVSTALLALWSEWLLPLVTNIAGVAAPLITAAISTVCNVLGSVLGVAADVIGGIMGVVSGLIDFITGVFTADWTKAWDGVCRVFINAWNAVLGVLKGIVNVIIDLINGTLRGICGAVNGVIGAVNTLHFTVPKWVPGIGGADFGIHLGSVSTPQIPKLANGAVIPPNAEFLAVLGDQKSGRNLEAPESLLRKIVREESGQAALDITLDTPVQVRLDGDVLYAAMETVRVHRGAEIGGAFANAV